MQIEILFWEKKSPGDFTRWRVIICKWEDVVIVSYKKDVYHNNLEEWMCSFLITVPFVLCVSVCVNFRWFILIVDFYVIPYY